MKSWGRTGRLFPHLLTCSVLPSLSQVSSPAPTFLSLYFPVLSSNAYKHSLTLLVELMPEQVKPISKQMSSFIPETLVCVIGALGWNRWFLMPVEHGWNHCFCSYCAFCPEWLSLSHLHLFGRSHPLFKRPTSTVVTSSILFLILPDR